MIATGIIVEYNPFHNGHLYHIKQSREHTDADVIIAIMSGHFLQRGEPAFVDKWTRTKMALENGADLVIELPYIYATAQASDFAKGGVLLLEALQCDFLSFGSEQGDITPFFDTYKLLEGHNKELQESIKQLVKTGLSYPQALNTAYQQLISDTTLTYADLTKPNNILGYHYVENIQKYNANIKPITIQRIQAGYHEKIENGKTIASATGIRQEIQEKHSLQSVTSFLPKSSFHSLTEWHEEFKHFASWELFWPYLRFSILRLSPEQISLYAEVTEGIEFSIIQAAKECNDFNSFMHKVKSKRYTWTRIQRMITHIFTNFTWQQLHSSNQPSYIRLLGMSKNGQHYLSERKKLFTLPVISRVASSSDSMLLQDIHATDLYMLALGKNKMGMDYKIPPIRY